MSVPQDSPILIFIAVQPAAAQPSTCSASWASVRVVNPPEP